MSHCLLSCGQGELWSHAASNLACFTRQQAPPTKPTKPFPITTSTFSYNSMIHFYTHLPHSVFQFSSVSKSEIQVYSDTSTLEGYTVAVEECESVNQSSAWGSKQHIQAGDVWWQCASEPVIPVSDNRSVLLTDRHSPIGRCYWGRDWLPLSTSLFINSLSCRQRINLLSKQLSEVTASMTVITYGSRFAVFEFGLCRRKSSPM